MQENISGEVVIPDMSYDVFYALLLYLYTGRFVVSSPDIAFELLKLSETYLIYRLKCLCEQMVLEGIDVENAAALFIEADRYSCPQLRQGCLDFINSNYREVFATEDFANIPKPLLMEITASLT